MRAWEHEEMEGKQKVLSGFFQSDTEKIHLIVGSDEFQLYNFQDAVQSLAVQKQEHRVFRYEIREKELSRHFLFRWLWETVHGQGYLGFGTWPEAVGNDPHLLMQLRLLVKKDIRPLEIRFLEAIRFISRKLEPDQRLILSIVPRTDLQDPVFVDFFRFLLRMLPSKTKLLIGQMSKDVLAMQADFSPSNRLMVEEDGDKGAQRVSEHYAAIARKGGPEVGIMEVLTCLVHPVNLDCLSAVIGKPVDVLKNILLSPDLSELVEPVGGDFFRLRYPRLTLPTQAEEKPCDSIVHDAVNAFEKFLSDGKSPYPFALYHSQGLFRLEDPEVVASQTLAWWRLKMDMGAGEICEEELAHAVKLMGEDSDNRRVDLLLAQAEVREGANRNREALEVLDPAVELLRRSGRTPQLQLALELKGRALFSLREMESAGKALDASLNLAREMGKIDLVADLCSQLGYLYFSRTMLQEAERFYRESLEGYRRYSEEDERGGKTGEAAQWSNLGHTFYARGDFKKAAEYHRKALDLFESVGDRAAAANQWGCLGHTFFGETKFEEAIEAYERAAQLEEELGEPRKAVQRLASVGHSLYAQRKVDLAIQSFKKALERYRDLGDPEGEAAQISNLGMVFGDSGEYDSAVAQFEQAARIYRDLGDPLNEAAQILRQGHTRRAQKRYEEAEGLYGSVLERYKGLDYRLGEGSVELDLGQMYSEKKEWKSAIECFDRAKSVYGKLGEREKESLCLALIGYAEQGGGNLDAALDSFRKALELYRDGGNDLAVFNVVSQMGLLEFQRRNYEEAERLYKEALEGFRKKENAEGEANLLSNLATMYYQTGRMEGARETYEKALGLLKRLNHLPGLAGVLKNMSYVYEKEEKLSEAHAQLREASEIYRGLGMEDEVEAIAKRMAELNRRAAASIEKMRAELFPGLTGEKSGKKKDRVGRNDACPCGSGKKFKKCCGE